MNKEKVYSDVPCNCGCGGLPKKGNKYITTHNLKNLIKTEEHRQKIGLSNKGKKRTEEQKNLMKEKSKEYWTKERRASFSGKRNPSFGKEAWNKGKKLTEEQIKNFSKSHLGQVPWNKNTKGIMVAWNKGLTKETDIRVKIYAEKVTIALSGRKNPEHILRMKEIWQDPKFVKKQMKSRNVMPNKTEMYLQQILNSIFFENQFLYVGDGEEIIGGKCPDFIDPINNKIIELYGDYWHNGQDPNDRINYFKQYGYNTLVIWEHELKDITNLKKKLGNFITCQ